MAGVKYVVLTWVPDSILGDWNRWHNEHHIPAVMAAPQMRGVRKYRVEDAALGLDWSPQYATIYDLESLEEFEAYRTGPGVAMRREYESRYGGVGRTARLVLEGGAITPSGD